MSGAAHPEFIEVASNVLVHIRDWGLGQPVLLIPGWPFSNGMYDYQMTALSAKGFRPIAVSQRGFGKSDKPWGPYTYDIYADDIKVILEKLNLRDVTLCGHSMGGAVAIRYMTRHQGNRVSRLALFGPAAPIFTQREDYPYGLKKSDVDAFIRAVDIDRPQLFTDFGKIFGATETSINPGHAAWMHAMNMEASPWAVAQSLIALRDTDLRSELDRISVPTVIFHGLADKICPFAFAQELSRGIDNSRIVRFEKSGHGLFLEEKDKFNQELMAFASQTVSVGAGRGAGG